MHIIGIQSKKVMSGDQQMAWELGLAWRIGLDSKISRFFDALPRNPNIVGHNIVIVKVTIPYSFSLSLGKKGLLFDTLNRCI